MSQNLALSKSGQAVGFRLDEDIQIGEILARSGFFSDSKEAAQAVVKMMAGRELGFGPIASMTGINIIKGKVSISAHLMAAAIKRSGRYNYRVTNHDKKSCTIEFYEHGEKIGVSTFDETDAKEAGLLDQDNFRKFRRNMLFARALSNGFKWFMPDLSGGAIYTPDELGERVDEDGELVIEAQPLRALPPKPVEESKPTQAAKQKAQGPDIEPEGPEAIRDRIRRMKACFDEMAIEPPAYEGDLSKLPIDTLNLIDGKFKTALMRAIAGRYADTYIACQTLDPQIEPIADLDNMNLRKAWTTYTKMRDRLEGLQKRIIEKKQKG